MAQSRQPAGRGSAGRDADDRPQRNAFLPGILAAAVLFFAPALIGNEWFPIVLYVAAILGLIVAWFAAQARQWWWTVVFIAVALLWNPVMPFAFEGPLWVAAQPVAGIAFLVAGILIKSNRA